MNNKADTIRPASVRYLDKSVVGAVCWFHFNILHSDQGWHYQNNRYQNVLEKNGIEQSMSRKGNCLDNAMMENFFGIMKVELLYSRQWNSMEEFKRALRKYINYYNNERIKLRLNGMSPVQYRTQYA